MIILFKKYLVEVSVCADITRGNNNPLRHNSGGRNGTELRCLRAQLLTVWLFIQGRKGLKDCTVLELCGGMYHMGSHGKM